MGKIGVADLRMLRLRDYYGTVEGDDEGVVIRVPGVELESVLPEEEEEEEEKDPRGEYMDQLGDLNLNDLYGYVREEEYTKTDEDGEEDTFPQVVISIPYTTLDDLRD